MNNQFLPWLVTQTERDDPIGDLARDVCGDRARLLRYYGATTWPNVSFQSFYRYLLWHSACVEALDAATAAFCEWTQS